MEEEEKKEVVSEKRNILIVMKEDGSVSVLSKALFTAGEMKRIRKSVDRWYRVSRRNFQVEQNKLRKD